MSQSPRPADAALIADLNDLLQLDHDAVEAYTLAIDVVRSATWREQLVEFRADHKRHIEELAALVRARGGLPVELPHPTAPLKLAVQALGAAPNDATLLLAFKAVEGQGRDKYRRFAGKSYPEDVADVVTRAAADEGRHYEWVERALREAGVGAGTLAHGVASAVEGLHKVIADPIEAVGRKVMEHVGNVVGTTRERGGEASEAPSPADVAGRAGMPGNPAAAAMSAAGAAMGAARNAAAGVSTSGVTGNAAIFIAALRALEEQGDLDTMVALHADDAELSGPTDERPHAGREGARAFWRMYRDSFQEIRSSFTNVVEGPEGTAMLEWTSEGRSLTGGRVGYAGVSVVEMRDGRVRRFRTYFDSRDLTEVRHVRDREGATRGDDDMPTIGVV